MKKTSRKSKSKKCIALICWIIIPIGVLTFIILDGIGLYSFTTERLIVLGVCVVVVLLPFFSEITIKNFSIKKDSDNK